LKSELTDLKSKNESAQSEAKEVEKQFNEKIKNYED
jgi:hypothetical protein